MKWAFLMKAGFARIVYCAPAGTPALPGLPTSYSSYRRITALAYLTTERMKKLFVKVLIGKPSGRKKQCFNLSIIGAPRAQILYIRLTKRLFMPSLLSAGEDARAPVSRFCKNLGSFFLHTMPYSSHAVRRPDPMASAINAGLSQSPTA